VGKAWRHETDAAWRELLDDLDWYVQHPDQAQTAAA